MMVMALFLKRKPKGSSKFSEFIRTASSKERKRVYSKVLDKATERQQAVMECASSKGSK